MAKSKSGTKREASTLSDVAAGIQASKPVDASLKTGLGETIEEVEAKCTKALKEFLAIVKKGEKAPLNDLLEAAFQWALPEKRARKLRKKIAGK
jgi:hypothetical protein